MQSDAVINALNALRCPRRAALAEVGIADIAHQPLNSLSGGQRQLAIASRISIRLCNQNWTRAPSDTEDHVFANNLLDESYEVFGQSFVPTIQSVRVGQGRLVGIGATAKY